MTAEREVLVRAHWSRPAWCRDDWCLVGLPNGYRYYSPVGVVAFDQGDGCWVRARLFDLSDTRGWASVKFLDFDGEGSLDGVNMKQVREVGTEGGQAP